MAVTPRSSSQRVRRLSSARTVGSAPNAPNRTSMVSRTTRFAPTRLIASSRVRKSPSRSKSPAATISVGSTRNASTASSPSRWSPVEVEAERAHVVGRPWPPTPRRSAAPPARRTSRAPATRNSQAQQRLARSCATRHQRYPAPGKPAPGDLVQAADSRRRLFQPRAHRGILHARQQLWCSRAAPQLGGASESSVRSGIPAYISTIQLKRGFASRGDKAYIRQIVSLCVPVSFLLRDKSGRVS